MKSPLCRLQQVVTYVLIGGALACSSAAMALEAQPEVPVSHGTLQTVAELDLPRYMGTWFEIAKFPNWFQKKCVAATQAKYQLQEDGLVQVVNRCRMSNGVMNEAIGTGRSVGPANSAKLQVRFAPAWLSFLPFVWGDYWVIDLDQNYQLVAVSEPRKEYLWVLARTPEVEAFAYQALLGRLAAQGFDVSKLELTMHE